MTRVLTLDGMSAGYDDVAVVRDLTLHVDAGEVVALLGPNGAGKTTTLLTVSGLARLLGGSVEVMGNPVPKLRRAYQTARWGVMHVPEDRGLFYQLSVEENLRLAPNVSSTDPTVAYELFPALERLAKRDAGKLSGGEQQMLALGRAFMARPSLLMVDEMSLGLAPVIYEGLMPMVRDAAEQTGCGVLLVEQHTDLALAQSDRGYVLNHGDLVMHGTSAELLEQRHMIDAQYLGSALPDDQEEQQE